MAQAAVIPVLSGSQHRAHAPYVTRARAPLWELISAGNMVELSGTAPGKLSTVARLIARAQALGEPVAWVTLREAASFYPPDFSRAGVDLAALVVVRVPSAVPSQPDSLASSARAQRGAYGVVRATELLLRSGTFGLVVVDLSHEVPKGELAWQSRLSGLVRMHDARLVLLTGSRPDEPSLGPLVALRIAPEVSVSESGTCVRGHGAGRAVLEQRVLKSKLGHGAEPSPDVRALPEGLA